MSPRDEEPGDGSCPDCGDRYSPCACEPRELEPPPWGSTTAVRLEVTEDGAIRALAKVLPRHDCPNCGAPIAGYGLMCLRCFRAPVGVRPREPKRSAKR